MADDQANNQAKNQAKNQERLRTALAARLADLGIAPDDPRVEGALAQVQALMQRGLAIVQGAKGGNASSAPLTATIAKADAPALPERLQALLDAFLAAAHGAADAKRPAWM